MGGFPSIFSVWLVYYAHGFHVHSLIYSKELLLCYTTTGKVLKRRPCEVCRYVMQNVHNSKDTATASVTICSQCGEANVRTACVCIHCMYMYMYM